METTLEKQGAQDEEYEGLFCRPCFMLYAVLSGKIGNLQCDVGDDPAIGAEGALY